MSGTVYVDSAFKSGVITWPRGGLLFQIHDLRVEVNKQEEYEDAYVVSFVLHSKDFAGFLDNCERIKNRLCSCPAVRHVAGSSGTEVLGVAHWEVMKPNWSGPAPGKVDPHPYERGSPLLRLGYSVILEKNLSFFLLESVRSLEAGDGLAMAHMPDGFISLDLGAFDVFYGFVFACYKAGKTAEDCHAILPNSGVKEMYPPDFDAGQVALADINALYDLLGAILKGREASSPPDTAR
jgi:hypothetical protein